MSVLLMACMQFNHDQALHCCGRVAALISFLGSIDGSRREHDRRTFFRMLLCQCQHCVVLTRYSEGCLLSACHWQGRISCGSFAASPQISHIIYLTTFALDGTCFGLF